MNATSNFTFRVDLVPLRGGIDVRVSSETTSRPRRRDVAIGPRGGRGDTANFPRATTHITNPAISNLERLPAPYQHQTSAGAVGQRIAAVKLRCEQQADAIADLLGAGAGQFRHLAVLIGYIGGASLQ
jgi:hypothetical protein